MKTAAVPTPVIVCDCSRFPELSRDQEAWLRRLVVQCRPADLLLCLTARAADGPIDDEPIASFDAASGVWWAGRYVGEVEFEGATLRIEPRFGMPSLMRWLGTIWGVRFLEMSGSLQQQRLWLWLVVAHLWTNQLTMAAKHGLPSRRVSTVHIGRALRGRLLPRETALARRVGGDRLMSETRTRQVDANIGRILLSAHARLLSALRTIRTAWLPDRAQALVSELQHALGSQQSKTVAKGCDIIRYTPITESYRSVVDLSLAILARRPPGTSTTGASKSFGVLLDMAEIWELYVAKVLQAGLPGLTVEHTGRTRTHQYWLLGNNIDSAVEGSLRPDIVIADHRKHCVAIVDAKYKTTRLNEHNQTGIRADDLYQITAYLSAFGNDDGRLDGFLVYPEDELGKVARRLAPRNAWHLTAAPTRRVWFVSAEVERQADQTALTASELRLSAIVQAALAAGRCA